jgi:hypothetical protein
MNHKLGEIKEGKTTNLNVDFPNFSFESDGFEYAYDLLLGYFNDHANRYYGIFAHNDKRYAFSVFLTEESNEIYQYAEILLK